MFVTKEKLDARQRLAVEEIDDTRTPLRMVGGPGVGKSTVISCLKSNPIRVAPNNKAATLIKGVTIHKLLNLTVKERNGEMVTLPTKNTPTRPLTAKVVFDEFSTIPKELLYKYILPLVPNAVFVGDDAQLNPIGESIIPVMGLDIPEIKLDKVHRFDGELLEVCYDIRKCVFDDKLKFCLPKTWESTVYHDLGPNDVIIAWRNETVNNYNMALKLQRFGTTDWVEGEHVRIGSYYERARLMTESEYKIARVRRSFASRYDAWEITLDNGVVVPVLHDDEREKWNEQLQFYADSENWPAFWAMKKEFCDLRPSFAITAHKAQGSTYDNAYVDYRDIFRNEVWNEAVRAAYVATSRARYKVRNLV